MDYDSREGNEHEFVHLTERVARALSEWIGERSKVQGGGEWLFVSLHRGFPPKKISGPAMWKIVKTACAPSRVKATPHKLRHSGITFAINQAAEHNIGLHDALAFSRHKSIDTLMIYYDRIKNRQGEIADLVEIKLEG